MTFDGHEYTSGFAADETGQIIFCGTHSRQQLICQCQQALAGRREADRTGLADEQAGADPVLQILELVGQG